MCRKGDNQRAFDHLGSALMHDPKEPRTILAAGSIIQVCRSRFDSCNVMSLSVLILKIRKQEHRWYTNRVMEFAFGLNGSCTLCMVS